MAQWYAYLLQNLASPGLILGITNFTREKFYVVDIHQWT